MANLCAIVVGSEHAAGEGVALGLRYPEVRRTIPYPLRRAFVEPVNIDGPRSGVAFAGALVARKNCRAALDGAALATTAITFANSGPEQPVLQDRAAEIGAPAHFPGEIPVSELRTLLAGSEALLLPSASESFGLLFIEALACGTPVIGFAPTLVEIQERLEISIGVPVEKPTPETIAAAIRRVRRSAWNRAELRDGVLRAFSVERAADEYAGLVRGVLGVPA